MFCGGFLADTDVLFDIDRGQKQGDLKDMKDGKYKT